MIDIELGAFLSGPRHSQQDALLRLIGTSIADPQGIDMMQMIDVHLPTTDGRELVLTRYTEPEPELSLLLNKLKLELPAQPPPKITAAPAAPNSL